MAKKQTQPEMEAEPKPQTQFSVFLAFLESEKARIEDRQQELSLKTSDLKDKLYKVKNKIKALDEEHRRYVTAYNQATANADRAGMEASLNSIAANREVRKAAITDLRALAEQGRELEAQRKVIWQANEAITGAGEKITDLLDEFDWYFTSLSSSGGHISDIIQASDYANNLEQQPKPEKVETHTFGAMTYVGDCPPMVGPIV